MSSGLPQVFRVNRSGYLGINTDPIGALTVKGDIYFSGNLYQNGILFVGGSGGGSSGGQTSTSGGWVTHQQQIYAPAYFNVGIGGSSTPERLSVSGNILTTGSFIGDGSMITNIHASNIPALAPSATIDTTSATNITSGVLPDSVLPATSATPGTYGDQSTVPIFTVDQYGRITSISSTPIAAQLNNIAGLANSATIDTTDAGNITTGTLNDARLPYTGVTANTYGDHSNAITITVDETGRLTSASAVSISIAPSQVTGLAPSATTDTTNASQITSGTLNSSLFPASGVIPRLYFNSAQVPAITVDQTGRLTSVILRPIQLAVSQVFGLASSATVDATVASNIRSGTLNAVRLPASMCNTSFSNTINIGTSTLTTSNNSFYLLHGTSAAFVMASNSVVISTDGVTPALSLSSAGATLASGSITAPLYMGSGAGLTTIQASNIVGLTVPYNVDTTNATTLVSGTVNAARLPSVMNATSFTGGNVGIGTTLPTSLFQVAGIARIDAGIYTSNWVILPTSSNLQIQTSNASAPNLQLDNTGNIGIGTSVTFGALHVADAAGAFVVQRPTVGSPYMQVGIGTTNPIAALDVQSTGTAMFGSNVTIKGGATVASNLSIKGVLTAQSNVSITGNATIYGSITSGGITSSGSLNVTSNVTLGGTLTTSNLYVLGATTTVNSFVTETSNVVIKNYSGVGPALSVYQKTIFSNGIIADFFDIDVSCNVPVFRIADGGNVGIGSSMPVVRLDVNDGVVRAASFQGSACNLTGLAPSAFSDTTNANNITSGKLMSSLLPINLASNTTIVGAVGIGTLVTSTTESMITFGSMTISPLRFPPQVFTSSATNSASNSGFEQYNGTYTVSADVNPPSYPHYAAFDGSLSTYWASASAASGTTNGYYHPTPYGNTSTIDANTSTTYIGNYIQLQIPSAAYLWGFTMTPVASIASTSTPVSFNVYGSTTGSTWYLLSSNQGVTWPTGYPAQTFTTNTVAATTTAYSYFRLVVGATNTVSVATGNPAAIANLMFLGSYAPYTGLSITGPVSATSLQTTNVAAPFVNASTRLNSPNVIISSNLTSPFVATSNAIIYSSISTSNINFTGSLLQNGAPYIGSQWTTINASNLSYSPASSNSWVGIGTTIPKTALHVNGGGLFSSVTTCNINFTGALLQNGAPYIGSQWTTINASNLAYSPASSNSWVGIGTTTPFANLHVAGGGLFTTLSISDAPGYVSTHAIQMFAPVATSGNYNDLVNKTFVLNGSNAVYTAGNVGIGTTTPNVALDVWGDVSSTGDVISYNNVSDRRLKTNIQPLSDALELIMALNPVTFDWKDDVFNESKRGCADVGLIAQDVAEVIPSVVIDYNQTYKGIRYEKLVPFLIKAVQELADMVAHKL